MDVDLRKFPLIPYNTTQARIGGNLRKFLFARPPRTACGFAKREREFLSISPLHGIILAIFENAKNGRKKTGNLFLISCLGVPFCM